MAMALRARAVVRSSAARTAASPRAFSIRPAVAPVMSGKARRTLVKVSCPHERKKLAVLVLKKPQQSVLARPL
jgi:hypothetical protein